MTDVTASAFAIPERAPAIRIGDVFGQARKMFAARWAIYSAVVMIGYAPLLVVSATTAMATKAGNAPAGFSFSGPILFGILGFAILMLAHGVIYVSVFQDIGGRSFSIGRSIEAALRRSPALIALVLLIWIYATLAALLLVFPAIIVFCVYAVAFPACVVERLGPIKAMSRSAFLTKGNRWRVLGLLTVLYLGGALISQLILLLARLAGGQLFSVAVSAPVEGIVGGFSAAVIAVLYAKLRTAREGVDVDHVAAVFD